MIEINKIVNKPQRDSVLHFLAEPVDVSFDGKVHGGAVMKCVLLVGVAVIVLPPMRVEFVLLHQFMWVV